MLPDGRATPPLGCLSFPFDGGRLVTFSLIPNLLRRVAAQGLSCHHWLLGASSGDEKAGLDSPKMLFSQSL